jgi:hypothetical protein
MVPQVFPQFVEVMSDDRMVAVFPAKIAEVASGLLIQGQNE